MPPSRLVAQLTFPEPGTKGQQLYANGWGAVDRGRGGARGGEATARPAPPLPATGERGWGPQARRTLPPAVGLRARRHPQGLRTNEGTFAARTLAHRHPGPGFMNEIQSCGYK